MIEQAIATGAPLYNAGHASRCADIYAATITRMMNGECGEMPVSIRNHMRMTMSQVPNMHSADDRAWALRRTLDTVYSSMPVSPMPVSNCGN